MSEKQGQTRLGLRTLAMMASPTIASPLDESGNEHDLLTLSELRASANEPVAPEARGELAELESWDDPVNERGHRNGAVSTDDPTIGADLVQQGVDGADIAARKLSEDSPDGE